MTVCCSNFKRADVEGVFTPTIHDEEEVLESFLSSLLSFADVLDASDAAYVESLVERLACGSRGR